MPVDLDSGLAVSVSTFLPRCRTARSNQSGHQKWNAEHPSHSHAIAPRASSYHVRKIRNRALQFAIAAIAACPTTLVAAQSYSNNEISVGIAGQTWGYQYVANNQFAWDHYLAEPAPSFGYTRNLSPSLALDGEFRQSGQFFKTNALESGYETLALGGVKAGWRGARWGFYGKTEAGIESWSCGAWYYDPNPYSDCSRITNFALEYGGVIERRLAGRYSLRFDAAHLIGIEFPEVLERTPTATISRDGGTLQHLDVRFAVTRSLGSVHDELSEHAPAAARWDAGAAFLLQPRHGLSTPDIPIFPSPGVWASWNFSRHLSWDSALIYSGPMRDSGYVFSDSQAGGRSFEALTGIKAGLRRDRMGYFGKFRFGTITFGETQTRLVLLSNGVFVQSRGMFTDFVFDAGGVYEVYPSRHTILRFDAGSATIVYPTKSYFSTGEEITVPEEKQTGLLLSFGAGVRF